MKKYLIFILVILLGLMSCSKKKEVKEAKSISQIQKEKGIPVTVEKVVKSSLVKWDDYSSTLEGTKQVKVFGMLADELSSVDVKIGDRVEKNQVIAQYSTDNPQAHYMQAKIQVETMEKTYNRMKNIYKTGGISLQKLDEIEAQYKVSKENFAATKKLIEVKAPITGVVVDVFSDPGEMVVPSNPICKIAKISTLKGVVFVDEKKISLIRKNDKVIIKWDGLKNKEFEGKISKIALSADPKKRGFAVTIDIPNSKNMLYPGIFTDIFIKTIDLKNIIKIERNSIVKDEDKNYIYLNDNGKAKKVQVEMGKENAGFIQIISGLNENDNLIVDGTSLLYDGAKINIIK